MASPSQTIAQWEDGFEKRTHAAAHDFRSDTVTLPSGPMLSSILAQAAGLGDDVMGEDKPTKALEAFMGELTGMGHAMFVMSGHMGNQLALRTWLLQPPYSIICDRRSHIFIHESGMASIFSQAHLIPIMPKNVEKQSYLTLEDIIEEVVHDDGNIHGAPTRIISLENTIWGKIMPLHELERISAYAKEQGIIVHMDGARLWNACYDNSIAGLPAAEAAAAATSRLKQYCALVDSVSMCFSKSLGSPGGSILVAKTPEFIKKAKHFRKALGGGMRQLGVLTAPAKVAVETVFLSGEKMPYANSVAKDLEETWIGLGGTIQPGLRQETNMVWLDLKKAQVTDEEWGAIGKEEGLQLWDGRIVTHYQISQDAVAALKRVMQRAIEKGKTRTDGGLPTNGTKSSSYGKSTVPGE